MTIMMPITEILTLQEDLGSKIKFESEPVTIFWASMAASYPKFCDIFLSYCNQCSSEIQLCVLLYLIL